MKKLLRNKVLQNCLRIEKQVDSAKVGCTEICVKKNRTSKITQDIQTFSLVNLFYRDMHLCQYCGERHSISQLTYDYVMPRSLGGQLIWSNVVTACNSCKSKKAERSLEQAGMQLLTVPYAPLVAEYSILRQRNVQSDMMMQLYRRATDRLMNQLRYKNTKKLSFVGGSNSKSGCSSNMLLLSL